MKVDKIEVSFILGTSLQDAVWSAYNEVCKTNAIVTFKFNGLTVTIDPSPTSGGEVITRNGE